MKLSPEELPWSYYIKQDKLTNILWQPYKKNPEDLDWRCALSTCKKPMDPKKTPVILEDDQTGLIALFHVECFKSILKPDTKYELNKKRL